MELSERAKRVMAWREHLTLLPDELFLDRMRTYLGPIKTPYNKQSLIDSLCAFLRRDDVRNALVTLLCADDRSIISAVSCMPDADENKLHSFFRGTGTDRVLHERMVNLEERLVLFRMDKTPLSPFCVNPLLEDALRPLLSPAVLLCPSVSLPLETAPEPSPLSDSLVASFVSFVASHPDCCKGDGSFKKRTLSELSACYTEGLPLQRLFTALSQLELLHRTEKTVVPDWRRMELFSALPPETRAVYLCVASCGLFSRSELKARAQLLSDMLCSVPPTGLSRGALERLVLLIEERSGESAFAMQPGVGKGRFARLIRESSGGTMEFSPAEAVSSCVDFGLLYAVGTDGDGLPLYASALGNLGGGTSEPDKKILEINAGGEVTLFPGRELSALVPLMKCLSLVRYDVACEYVLDRKSAFRAFDAGLTDAGVRSLLSDACMHDMPQSVRMGLEEWYAAYSSVMLYRGYVLTVSEKMRSVMEGIPSVARHVVKELSPGVLLLDFSSDDEAFAVLEATGAGGAGSIRTASRPVGILPLPSLSEPCPLAFSLPDADSGLPASYEEQEALLDKFREQLASSGMGHDQAEVLSERIERRIVLSASQLSPDCVRFERREADGMDYAGKMGIVEAALHSQETLEILVENGTPAVRGYPVEIIDKKTPSAKVRLMLDSGKTRDIPIGAAIRIKKATRTLDFN